MTTKAILVEQARRHTQYPDAPQSVMICRIRFTQYELGTTATLKEHFGNLDSTLVGNEARLGPV